MSKTFFEEKAFSLLLLTTFLSAAGTTAGFISSAAAVQTRENDDRASSVPYDLLPQSRSSAPDSSSLKMDTREYNQLVESVRSGDASTLWMTKQDKADFEGLFSPTGPIGWLPKDQHGRLLNPNAAREIIEKLVVYRSRSAL